jgi:hypothetical protein
MASPNLAITHIAAAQNQPEVTANGAFDALDNAENALVSFANSDADMTLTQVQLASGGAIKITGALTADRHVNLPASVERSFIFENATTGGHSLVVQVTGAPGSTITIAAAAGFVQVYSDGTNVVQLTGGSGGIFAAGGDLSGSSSSQTVVGLEGKPLDATTVGTPTDGWVITYDNASGKYKAKAIPTGAGLNFADSETPGGSINGSNAAFTLAHSPSPAGSLILVQRFASGGAAVLFPGGVDFTLSGLNITMVNAPATGDSFLAWYRY